MSSIRPWERCASTRAAAHSSRSTRDRRCPPAGVARISGRHPRRAVRQHGVRLEPRPQQHRRIHGGGERRAVARANRFDAGRLAAQLYARSERPVAARREPAVELDRRLRARSERQTDGDHAADRGPESRLPDMVIALLLAFQVGTHVYDRVILGGRVMDPASRLDAIRNVGLDSGRIAVITPDPIVGRDTIDARGLVVAPGFIDLHSHAQTDETYRIQALDGVTTALELEVGTADVPAWY